jgi:Ca-activated chloride channel family protein
MRLFPWVLVLAIARPYSAGGQDAVLPQEPPVFRSLSELVLLQVTVKDGRNRYLLGLPRDAFAVYHNGQPQEIRFFMDEDAPATIGLILDSSGSMQPSRDRVLVAVQTFVETSNTRDQIFALAFNDQVRPALPADQPFTNDPAVLRNALGRLPTYGQTALYDAMASGLEYLARGRHDRKALVIVSDGADNVSRTAFAEVAARIQESDVVLYAVQLKDPVGRNPTAKRLAQLVRATGGDAFTPDNINEVNDVLRHIAQDIRRAYVMAYAPPDDSERNAAPHVRVEVRAPGRGRITVRTRTGYPGVQP